MRAEVITTTFEEGVRKTVVGGAAFAPDESERELQLVNLYPQVRYQTVAGFGGAVTEAVGLVLQSLPPELAGEIISSYFGKEGIGYTMLRTHLDSCDFSAGGYSAVEREDDPELKSFSLSRDERNLLPYIKAAYDAAGEALPVMLSPWSPPAFMKTNGDRNGGGSLRPECYGLWARYICRYLREYRDRGINVGMLSVQNEPKATQRWDSCVYTGREEREFLCGHLYPELRRNGLGDVEVYIWDHNKERLFDRALEVIDPVSDPMVAGLAFHWYSGDHFDAVRLVRERYPDKKLVFSEGCIEYSRFQKDGQLGNAQMYAHDMIGNLNAGMNAFIDWNLALDMQGGPNHAGNFCEAPILCDAENKRIYKKLSYYYIRHFSKHIKPGAVRIATTCYSPKLEVTAFENPDGSIAVVVLNRTSEELPAFIRLYGELLEITAGKEAISTLIIRR